MKKTRLLLLAGLFAGAVSFTGCNGECDDCDEPDYSAVITFEQAVLADRTGLNSSYDKILWGFGLAEENDGSKVFDGIIYTEGGAQFGGYYNDYGGSWDTWGGFAVSQNYDGTDGGLSNQFSVRASDSGKFGIAYDLGGFNGAKYERPAIVFSEPCEPLSVMVANTTYTYLYCTGRIASGEVAGFYLTMTMTGYLGSAVTGSVAVSLSKEGAALADWTEVGLASLGRVDTVKFSFDSNDKTGEYLNPPAYCCIDNLKIK